MSVDHLEVVGDEVGLPLSQEFSELLIVRRHRREANPAGTGEAGSSADPEQRPLSACCPTVAEIGGSDSVDLVFGASNHHVFEIAEPRDLADFFTRRVVDADLGSHVPLGVESQGLDCPMTRAPVGELVESGPALVVVGEDDASG